MAGTRISRVSIAAALCVCVCAGACASTAPKSGVAVASATATTAPAATGASTERPPIATAAPATGTTTTPTPSATGTSSPSSSASAAPTTTASAAPKLSSPLFKAQALFDDPTFEGGDVPKTKETLEKFTKAVEKCVNDAGGVGSKGATIKIQFLVRMKGIAEGIDVLGATGLDEKPGKCVRDVFKKKPIGTPSSDPVGVTFTITFAPSGEPRPN